MTEFQLSYFKSQKTMLLNFCTQYESSSAKQFEGISSLVLSLLNGPTLISVLDYEKTHSFDYMNFCQQNDVSDLFNTLYSLVIAFLPKSKCLLIQSLSSVILELKKIRSVTSFTFSPSICHEVMTLDAMILDFWMLSFKPTFSHSFFNFIKRMFSFSLFSVIKMVSSSYLS